MRASRRFVTKFLIQVACAVAVPMISFAVAVVCPTPPPWEPVIKAPEQPAAPDGSDATDPDESFDDEASISDIADVEDEAGDGDDDPEEPAPSSD